MPRATRKQIEASTQSATPAVMAAKRPTPRKHVGNYTTSTGDRHAGPANATSGAFGKTDAGKHWEKVEESRTPEGRFWRAMGKQLSKGARVTVRHPDRRPFKMPYVS